MKKLTIILMTFLLCIALCSCSSIKTQPQETTTHTLPATQPSETELEWAQVDCDISLVDVDTSEVLLSSEDFTDFAVIGTNDSDSYIIIRTTEDAKDRLNTLSPVPSMQLVIYGETKASVTFNEGAFLGEIEIGKDFPYEAVCELANSIRGLF